MVLFGCFVFEFFAGCWSEQFHFRKTKAVNDASAAEFVWAAAGNGASDTLSPKTKVRLVNLIFMAGFLSSLNLSRACLQFIYVSRGFVIWHGGEPANSFQSWGPGGAPVCFGLSQSAAPSFFGASSSLTLPALPVNLSGMW
jgi:hypothetical protein